MQYSTLEEIIASYSKDATIIAILILLVLTVLAIRLKKLTDLKKKFLFSAIVMTVIVTTIFLAASTVYLNVISVSGGPVHWHADIEVWACQEEIDFVDPLGFSNKVGTSTLHEHNDKRIHLEGVVLTPQDASLGKFFKVIGGEISSNSITIPTNAGFKTHQTGERCSNGATSELQVFVYKTVNGSYFQSKIIEPSSYIISPYASVPEGDCIIIEFDVPKNKTDKLCRSYKVAEQIGKIRKL